MADRGQKDSLPSSPTGTVRVLVLNGPNLNLLGAREPEVYGHGSLHTIEASLRKAFPEVDFDVQQHNGEGALVDALHAAEASGLAGVVFNPGAYGHTSYALRDAIAAITTPVIEVHLSNVWARESFRQTLVLSGVCAGLVAGLGATGYHLAVEALRARADG